MLRQALRSGLLAGRALQSGWVASEAVSKRSAAPSSAWLRGFASQGPAIPTAPHGTNYHHAPGADGYAFYMPRESLIGGGSLEAAGARIKMLGLKKALIVTDAYMAKSGAVNAVIEVLKKSGVEAVVFDGAVPNPTDKNVEDGLALLKQHGCDHIVSFGGGSSHDCAKGVGIVATNGGRIHDYEGVDVSAKPMLPLISINTTAGTASEMTRFCIITDTSRMVKMAIVDSKCTPTVAVDDPLLMHKMPPSLTAATGMDALTHAVEAYVSTISTPLTDASALHAMKLISSYLRTAVADGGNAQARDMMSYAQFLAGMAFNSASLGYVHAMAHQLGGFYDLPHGVCNAVLLPVVQEFNAQAVPHLYIDMAEALGAGSGLPAERAVPAVLGAIRQLSADVGIPRNLKELGVKPEDFDVLAANSLKDACGFTNPRPASHEEIVGLFRQAYEQGEDAAAATA
ncbi:alcohol dehydrogenase [Chlorella sorokiniana]|uniref:Alcohol dehydrogenase 4 n=1 Tax=Chlorella sorokiniana TaxID=3076 RepID=A0A2P6TJ92_CHLSO|nr:alcohol dehydrogenase [Chlorella sorokiniana]|eukprot:PRW39303.1 alcohol dehydrogenase [Chlorella sorokiniana]